MLVPVVTTSGYRDNLVLECGGHRKVFVRVLSLDPVVVFGTELQITGDDLTQRMVVQ